MGNIIIRPLEQGEVKKFLGFFRRTMLEQTRGKFRLGKAMEDMVKRNPSEFIVAVDGDRFVGRVQIPYSESMKYITEEGEEKHVKGVYLCFLHVLGKYRGRGIATKLLTAVKDGLRTGGIDKAYASTESELREWYEEKGFKWLGKDLSLEVSIENNIDFMVLDVD